MIETIIEGKKFERLTALKNLNKKHIWLFRCDCGKLKKICKYNVIYKTTKSCGCLFKEESKTRFVTHGLTGTPFYHVWSHMYQRTLNSNDIEFKNYGGRGIKVCEKWKIFSNFRDDMYESYTESIKNNGLKNTTLDRIDNEKGYFKENCRWASHIVQNRNMRNSTWEFSNGKWFKICKGCKSFLEVSENNFYKRNSGQFISRCKECSKRYTQNRKHYSLSAS